MPNFKFGSGLLFATPINGVGPAAVFGTLQDVSVDFSKETKMLYGSNDFPDIIANGKSKVDIKAKFGQIQGSMFNSLFHGGTPTAGMTLFVAGEAATVPASGSYNVTAANASGTGILANSATDLVVRYAATGIALVNSGAVAPAAGQYQVSNGVYTFAAADASAAVLLTYYYRTTTVTTGTTFTRYQQPMGSTLFFSLFLSNSFNGAQENMKFFRAQSSKLTMASKNDDFMVPEMDFNVFADPVGRVFEEYCSPTYV